ncbi:hypothetical protein [Nocardioides lentus]|uniref:hypothetical protein n=1 Tax=Nocardioides lentus TaxID=338077 RepID=UPI0031D17DC0
MLLRVGRDLTQRLVVARHPDHVVRVEGVDHAGVVAGGADDDDVARQDRGDRRVDLMVARRSISVRMPEPAWASEARTAPRPPRTGGPRSSTG